MIKLTILVIDQFLQTNPHKHIYHMLK